MQSAPRLQWLRTRFPDLPISCFRYCRTRSHGCGSLNVPHRTRTPEGEPEHRLHGSTRPGDPVLSQLRLRRRTGRCMRRTHSRCERLLRYLQSYFRSRRTSQKGITQYAVTVTGVVERVRRSDAAVYPVTLIRDMDGLACMYETAVLCTAAVEVLAAVLNQALCGLGSERKAVRSPALQHCRCKLRSFCGIFIKCNLCLTSCDYNISILIGYFRLRVAVLIGRIRILWNLRCVCCVVYGRVF